MHRALLAAVSLVLFAGLVCAQSTNATLSGRITDPSKARIAGARIVAINVSTNIRTASTIFTRTAPPVDVVSGLVFADGIDLYPGPDVVSGVPLVLYGSSYPGGKALNPAAFVAPTTGQQGDFGRNVLRGFGAWQADFALQKQFHLTEKMGLRLRGEFFNLFNHANFGPPNNNLTDPLFGQSTQTLASGLAGGDNAGFNPLYQIGGPRSIQLALKLQF